MNLSQRMEFATNRFIFFLDLIPALQTSHKEIINVPTIQMSIFIFFVYAWVLFGVTFSLWLSLKIYSPVLLDFVRWKIVISENLRTVNHGSRTVSGSQWLQTGHKSDINVEICGHEVIVKLFCRRLISLVKFS